MSENDTIVTFLGTGTSVGVPVIGCPCEICASTDPRNNRTRSSVFITFGDTKILVDSGPDLREQALREKMTSLDAVLYTHSHLDHVVGFDELRAFCWSREEPLPMYGTASTLDSLRKMFGWAFHQDNIHRGYIKPDPRIITGSFQVGGFMITPLPVEHGSVETVGYLFESDTGKRIAYTPDVKTIPKATMKLMGNLDLLIIDALRETPHPTHLSLKESIAISESLHPKKTFLTHLSHDIDHTSTTSELPASISLAYDGLKVSP
ncbi:MAG: MBL fold metallo-hydrolase [Luteolibacter sp.]